MNKHKKYFLTPLIILTTLFLTACGGDSNKPSIIELANQQGMLHINVRGEPQDLDPHTVTGVPENRILTALFVGLTMKNGTTLLAEPAIAEKWDISADQTRYTFTLRDDAFWSNGDPVIASDFVYSWKRLLSPALASEYANSLFPLKNGEAYFNGDIDDFTQVGVKAINDKTLAVELHSPTPYFVQLLDHYSTYPLHPATIEAYNAFNKRGTEWTRPGNIVTNGPFELVSWQLNKSLVVAKNQRYFGKDRIHIEGITFYTVEKETVEERMFRAQQLHITEDIPNEKIPGYLKEKPEVTRVEPYLGTYYYELNVESKPLDNIKVRKALAYSIDREQLTATILKGGQLSSSHFIPPNVAGYNNIESPVQYNPVLAKKLLAEAGFPDGKGFPTLRLLYNTQEQHRLLAAAVQQMWKQTLNVDIELTNQEWKVYIDSRNNGDFDVARAAWIGDYPDPNTFADMMLSNNGNNRARWKNVKYDQLVAQANRTVNRFDRMKLFQQSQAILLEEVPIIPIYTYTSKKLIHPSVVNWPSNIMNYFNHYRDVKLSDVEDN